MDWVIPTGEGPRLHQELASEIFPEKLFLVDTCSLLSFPMTKGANELALEPEWRVLRLPRRRQPADL